MAADGRKCKKGRLILVARDGIGYELDLTLVEFLLVVAAPTTRRIPVPSMHDLVLPAKACRTVERMSQSSSGAPALEFNRSPTVREQRRGGVRDQIADKHRESHGSTEA
jgi:hypothetical protein